eukprot:5952190-Prymnesium_polylepis.3
MDAHRASATASTKADATVGTRAMGTPGEMLDRWNFDYEGEPFVQGSPPFLALRLRTTAPPSAIECPVRAANPESSLAHVPLVGVCSDMLQK